MPTICEYIKLLIAAIVPGPSGIATNGTVLDSNEVYGELISLGLRRAFSTMGDNSYFYVTREDWVKAFSYCFSQMPSYIKDRRDCEDMALIMKAYIIVYFGINCMAICYGQSQYGYHGYNLFRDEFGWHVLEPNPQYAIDPNSPLLGKFNIVEIGQNGYIPVEYSI